MPQPGISYPASLSSGTTARDTILQGYVFASGIHDVEHSNVLSWKNPQYYVTTILDRLGASEPVAEKVFSWNTMDRTREGSSIVAAAGNGTTTATIETDFTYAGTDLGYFVVGDIVRFKGGALGRVTAVGDAATLNALGGTAGQQAIEVTKEQADLGGSEDDWTVGVAGEIEVGDSFGHSHSSFGEASSAPTGRLYLPEEEFNYLTILRRSFSVSGSEFTNRTRVGDGSAWYFTIEDIEMKNFAKDRENAIFFGKQYTVGNRYTSRGLLDFVLTDGVNNGYSDAAGLTETDLQEHIKDLLVAGSSNEMLVLCGANFLKQAQVALRDYAVAGAINYGSLGDNTAGLDFSTYIFMGKKIHFAYYELFNDAKIVPYTGTPGAEDIAFDDFSIWLDFGEDTNGRSNIIMKHKELNGNQRKFIHAYEVGMMNPMGANGGMVSTGDDRFTIHYLSEIGLEVRQAHRMGILRANAA